MWIYFVINSSLAIGIGDPVASVGRLPFSITDRRNSSLRKKTLRYVSVRHHRSGVQKKQDDTRQSSNGPRTRTPPTYVITELQTGLDLRNNILSGNNPDDPVSYCCKFLFVFLCRLALPLDEGFYAGRPLERGRGSG